MSDQVGELSDGDTAPVSRLLTRSVDAGRHTATRHHEKRQPGAGSVEHHGFLQQRAR